MQKKTLSCWEEIKERLITEFGSHTYKFWIEPLEVHEVSGNTLEFTVPNIFFSNWIRERYMDKILLFLKDVTGEEFQIKLTVAKIPSEITAPQIKTTHKETQVISKHVLERLNPQNTFEEFIVGECNKLAHAATFAITISPAKAYNPLFIYGGVGLGKTHLLHAIGHEIINRFPRFKVHYISSEEFTNQLVHSIQTRSTARFRERYRNVDLLLIDDIQFLAGKAGMQEEFFHTFNALYDFHKQIVISSDRSPKEIPDLEERLVSRFHWGLVVDVQKPDYETRLAILQKKVFKFKLIVANDVLSYIAEKISSNIRELEGALLRVVAHATLIEERIDLPLVEKVLRDMVQEESSRVSIPYIQEKVAKLFNISLADLKSKSRKQSVTLPRQLAIYLIRKHTDSSLNDIGSAFGGKDHTTVIHAVQKIEREKENKLKQIVDKLEEKILKNT
ncbi:MAG: chromosomal replication initiator protein DnaA [Candidatus Saelkia tenebricola]|nr:chromosomal replication initiator protein DnaA [Candidatus Saelkia tenebricola]